MKHLQIHVCVCVCGGMGEGGGFGKAHWREGGTDLSDLLECTHHSLISEIIGEHL